jgi:hypothetical protein
MATLSDRQTGVTRAAVNFNRLQINFTVHPGSVLFTMNATQIKTRYQFQPLDGVLLERVQVTDNGISFAEVETIEAAEALCKILNRSNALEAVAGFAQDVLDVDTMTSHKRENLQAAKQSLTKALADLAATTILQFTPAA